MNKTAEKALSMVGQGYIYGAKGQICSPDFRRQQADQYPEQAEHILGEGAKWDGVPVWDCAQLTREAAKEEGVVLVSGATSQWEKTDWQERGEISALPEGETLFLYRRKTGDTTVMQHTGVAIGDGTCVHARGTAYGVVHQNVNEYPWTHWARPRWKEEEPELYTAKVIGPEGETVNLRSAPSTAAGRIDRVPVGKTVEVMAEGESWHNVRYGEKTGWMMSEYIEKEGNGQSDTVTIVLPREAAKALKNALEKVSM